MASSKLAIAETTCPGVAYALPLLQTLFGVVLLARRAWQNANQESGNIQATR
jgi:hypothetical protein